ncbi:MFS transporter [Haloferax larsenii]|uniref:Major Facilitator Superfamily protein n=1 Tax=Haloferax larsenii TaxID=302484 RepID=A0A1H7NBJ6_HALLR|nr:MFS transporter [Haloferax larsenii]SEL20860.1 Major Facilitator Superfamily protein [Haloferax larsenii]
MGRSRSLLRRYYLFRVTNTSGFFLPVAMIILQHKGFGLGFIGLAYGVYAFAKILLEIPTGYVGDWLGRRASLAAGSAVRVLVLGVYPFVDTAAVYLGVHVLWAVGRSFRSGTQDAWLYELLQARFDEDEFARIESRGSFAKLAVDAATALAAGVLYSFDPALPFVATAAIAAVGIPILYAFPSIDRLRTESDDASLDSDRDVLTVGDAIDMLRIQLRRPQIRWFVLFASLFYSLFVVTRIYEQPALDAVGIPVTGFGVLYAGFKVFSAGMASTVGWLHDRLGTKGVMLSLIPIYGVAYASIALSPLLVVPVLFLNRGLNTVVRPVRNQYLNDRMADVARATVLSGASMALAVIGGTARIAAGWATELLGPVGFLPWAGVTLATAAGVLWLLVSPVRHPEVSEGGSPASATMAE